MPDPVGVGILLGGAGAAEPLDALRAVPEARLLALCGEDEAAVRRLARERDAQPFASFDRMLGCRGLGLILVGPACEHVAKAIGAGKHVLADPPLAASLDEATALREAAAKAGVRLGLALPARHHPRSQALRRAVAAGRIGDLALARYSLRAAAPPAPQAGPDLPLIGQLMQALDLLAVVVDARPTRLFALARTSAASRDLSVQLTLASGAVATVETHLLREATPREDLLLVGTKGCLRAGTDHDTRVTLDAAGATTSLGDGIPPSAGRAEGLRLMLRHLAGGPPPFSPDYELRLHDLALAALRSAESGQPVALA